MKIALVLKGNIRRRTQFDSELQQLRHAFPTAEISVLESTRPGQSRELAATLCGECDYLVSVGGDGTLNEVVNGCMEARAANPELPLPHFAILAYGTANDMVRSLGMAGDIKELCSLLSHQQHRQIDLGKLQYTGLSGESQERYFLNVADIGIGAEVVQQLGNRSHYLGNNLHYLRATISTFLSYQHRELHVTFDGKSEWHGKTLALAAANGCFFGSGLCVAPGAALDDGQLFITLVGNASTVDFVRNLRKLKKGMPLDHPEARYDHARTLDIESEGDPAPIEVDGEFLGMTPAHVEILPLAVSCLAPAPQD